MPMISGGSGVPVLAAGKTTLSSGNITTASTTFGNATGVAVTITTGARRCLVVVNCCLSNTAAGNLQALDLAVDGTRVGNGTTGLLELDAPGNNFFGNAAFSYVTDVLTAASHTFQLVWRVGAGTSTLSAVAALPAVISAVELLQTA